MLFYLTIAVSGLVVYARVQLRRKGQQERRRAWAAVIFPKTIGSGECTASQARIAWIADRCKRVVATIRRTWDALLWTLGDWLGRHPRFAAFTSAFGLVGVVLGVAAGVSQAPLGFD